MSEKPPKKPAVRLVGLHSDDDVPSEYIELGPASPVVEAKTPEEALAFFASGGSDPDGPSVFAWPQPPAEPAAPTILESARKLTASIAAKHEVRYQACGDIDAGAVAIVCEHGRIKQHGTPCGYKRR